MKKYNIFLQHLKSSTQANPVAYFVGQADQTGMNVPITQRRIRTKPSIRMLTGF